MPEMSILRGDLAAALNLAEPLSLVELADLFAGPEELTFNVRLDNEGLHGEVHLVIRSNGTYEFSGYMRATGAFSYAYKAQVTVKSSAGTCLYLEASGRAFGSDTPGDRQRDWKEQHESQYLSQLWTAIRSGSQMDVHLDKNVAGTLGAVVDVAKTVLETYVALQFAGTTAAIVLLGSELASATGQTFKNPNLLVGAIVAGGAVVLLGPGAIVPAIAAGAATAVLADIRFRPMSEQEVVLARTVFGDKVPVDRIIITDLYNPGTNGIAREFAIPSLDGSILVNMGKNYEATLEPDVQKRSAYSHPGQVLIHELTHAWQIQYAPFMPGFLCRGMFGDKNYEYDQAKVAAGAPWNPTFGLEEQATIVDRWYGTFVDSGPFPGPGLESPPALQDPRFHYVSENIRVGRT